MRHLSHRHARFMVKSKKSLLKVIPYTMMTHQQSHWKGSVVRKIVDPVRKRKKPPPVVREKKMKKRERLMECMNDLDFSLKTSSWDDVLKILFKMRRIKVTEKVLLKTKAGIRLTALIKQFRKNHKKHLERAGWNESDKRVLVLSKLKQVKNTWKAEIKESIQKFTPVLNSLKKKKRKSGGLMNRKVKRVKTVEETSKVVNRESISTAGKPTWNIKSVSKKSETQHKFIDRLGSSIPKDSVVRKIVSTKKKKKKKRELHTEVEEKGNESSDMEV